MHTFFQPSNSPGAQALHRRHNLLLFLYELPYVALLQAPLLCPRGRPFSRPSNMVVVEVVYVIWL